MKLTARHRRIIKALQAGDAPCVIAPRFRTTPDAIRSLAKRLRAAGHNIPIGTGAVRAPVTKVNVPRFIASRLRATAKRRGLAPRELISAIVAEVIKRDLIPELLDRRAS